MNVNVCMYVYYSMSVFCNLIIVSYLCIGGDLERLQLHRPAGTDRSDSKAIEQALKQAVERSLQDRPRAINGSETPTAIHNHISLGPSSSILQLQHSHIHK